VKRDANRPLQFTGSVRLRLHTALRRQEARICYRCTDGRLATGKLACTLRTSVNCVRRFVSSIISVSGVADSDKSVSKPSCGSPDFRVMVRLHRNIEKCASKKSVHVVLQGFSGNGTPLIMYIVRSAKKQFQLSPLESRKIRKFQVYLASNVDRIIFIF